ncbi:MAG: lipopolysaccharide kinase InaA family protein, partial [Propionibacteriaceae bacterium]|nr:lipopolysaccharide kinase InaA family protein [Propionibacteriaceae bacterium]
MSVDDQVQATASPDPDAAAAPALEPAPLQPGPDQPPLPIVTDIPEVHTEPTVVVTLQRATAVGVHDHPAVRLRYPADLLGIIGCAVGMALVCLLVVYAGHTTQGLTEDVQGVAKWFQRLLTGPVLALRTILVLFAPIAVSVALLLRRQSRILLTALAASLIGLILNTIVAELLKTFAPERLFSGLALGYPPAITMESYAAAITALLVAASKPARRKSLTISWTLLWVTVGVDILTQRVTLGGIGLSLLVGCLIGLACRYTVGVPSERAYGPDLIAGLRQVGYDPATLDRASLVQLDADEGRPVRRVQVPQFFADHRLYALKTTSGEMFDVIVLDGDRQVVGVLGRWWRQLRSRGIDPRSVTSLRQSAERAALLAYSVKEAGVRTPGVVAIAEAMDSMLIIRDPVPPSTSVTDLAPEEVDDRLLRLMWRELGKAHRAGISHRGLADHVFRVHVTAGGARQLWVLGWEAGDVA